MEFLDRFGQRTIGLNRNQFSSNRFFTSKATPNVICDSMFDQQFQKTRPAGFLRIEPFGSPKYSKQNFLNQILTITTKEDRVRQRANSNPNSAVDCMLHLFSQIHVILLPG